MHSLDVLERQVREGVRNLLIENVDAAFLLQPGCLIVNRIMLMGRNHIDRPFEATT